MKQAEVRRANLVPLRLDFFEQQGGQEKTEKATPKKRKKARDEGQVAKSQEVSTATQLIVGFSALFIFGGLILSNILDLITHGFGLISVLQADFNPVYIAQHVAWGFGRIILIALPVFFFVVLASVIVNLFQVGWNPTHKPLKPKFSKLNPIKGFKKIFGLQALVNFAKSMLKLVLVGVVVYVIISGEAGMLAALFDVSFTEAVSYIAGLMIRIGITIGVLYIFIALFDWAYTKWKHEKDIRMSKHEVKEEWKQMEGNPLIKGKIRQKMREVSMRRMMQGLPQADVIITNPTHYAVALKYDMFAMGGAPVLVAKGVDFMAKRIREAGIEHDIPIVENPPLARAIYDDVDLEQEIPEELYVAVAEIMAYVFKLKNRVAA